jgi:hypothetical protein
VLTIPAAAAASFWRALLSYYYQEATAIANKKYYELYFTYLHFSQQNSSIVRTAGPPIGGLNPGQKKGRELRLPALRPQGEA